MHDGEARRVDYLQWLLTVICWDGLLPLCVVVLPLAVKFFWPNNWGVIAIIAGVLPVVFFLVRLAIGYEHIRKHQVPEALRLVQYTLFFTALFLLALIEGFVVLMQFVPGGAVGNVDHFITLMLFLIYLLAMVIAFYPGPTDQAAAEPSP